MDRHVLERFRECEEGGWQEAFLGDLDSMLRRGEMYRLQGVLEKFGEYMLVKNPLVDGRFLMRVELVSLCL